MHKIELPAEIAARAVRAYGREHVIDTTRAAAEYQA